MIDPAELNLISRIRQGDELCWQQVIELFEGRLLAFAKSRVGNQSLAEDIVQDTFVGFLTSLPNYDENQSSLESFLFRITAHKITDALRKKGRRPSVQMSDDSPSIAGNARKASSMARSRERGSEKRDSIKRLLEQLISQWKSDQNYDRLKCCELLFARGWTNKKVAAELNFTEQQVANHKQSVMQKLKNECKIEE
ncbi:MAG: sigma-70 family RNA polymerase sigma factor [Planctomycetaceae bacterium]|nr:sigma-70 family RNA polymerase sigma factor [Planctomycetaceae bacterium]